MRPRRSAHTQRPGRGVPALLLRPFTFEHVVRQDLPEHQLVRLGGGGDERDENMRFRKIGDH